MECLGVACGLWAVQWLTGSYKLCQCLVCQMCGERVAWAACQRQSAQLPGTSLYPIRQFGMSETPILVSSCPLPKLSHPSMKNTARARLAPHSVEPRRRRYTYLETITRERMVQSVPRFVFVCCCCSLTLCAFSLRLPRQNHRLNEHASLCFLNISSESRVRLEICFLGMCEVWGEEQKKKKKKDAVCLCVALLDMMRDDIMVDAAAAAAVRWGRIPFVSRSLRVMCLSVTLHKTGHWCSSK